MWLNPDDSHELLWDYGMCVDTSRGAAVRDLIAKALKGPLVPPQQEVPIYNLLDLNMYYPVYIYDIFSSSNLDSFSECSYTQKSCLLYLCHEKVKHWEDQLPLF